MNTRLKFEELQEFLDEKVEKFNRPGFIEKDPIQIPHRFSRKEDVEISAFLTATIAWGRRNMIIRNANQMMALMDNAPYDFITQHEEDDLKIFEKFVHRTFQAEDLKFFIKRLKVIYNNGGLESLFVPKLDEINLKNAFGRFYNTFFDETDIKFRTRKHVANPIKGSSAKRLCMLIRIIKEANQNILYPCFSRI